MRPNFLSSDLSAAESVAQAACSFFPPEHCAMGFVSFCNGSSVAQAGWTRVVLLPQLPKFLDYRHATPLSWLSQVFQA